MEGVARVSASTGKTMFRTLANRLPNPLKCLLRLDFIAGMLSIATEAATPSRGTTSHLRVGPPGSEKGTLTHRCYTLLKRYLCDVRFTPQSKRAQRGHRCLLSAISRHCRSPECGPWRTRATSPETRGALWFLTGNFLTRFRVKLSLVCSRGHAKCALSSGVLEVQSQSPDRAPFATAETRRASRCAPREEHSLSLIAEPEHIRLVKS
jgi:hypothetical protein